MDYNFDGLVKGMDVAQLMALRKATTKALAKHKQTRKVVFNTSYGGFGLNNLGQKILKHFDFEYDHAIPRDHPILVRALEMFGDQIYGFAEHASSDFTVEQIELAPNETFRITEYDGNEGIEIIEGTCEPVPPAPDGLEEYLLQFAKDHNLNQTPWLQIQEK